MAVGFRGGLDFFVGLRAVLEKIRQEGCGVGLGAAAVPAQQVFGRSCEDGSPGDTLRREVVVDSAKSTRGWSPRLVSAFLWLSDFAGMAITTGSIIIIFRSGSVLARSINAGMSALRSKGRAIPFAITFLIK
jgi:hypothetical protein